MRAYRQFLLLMAMTVALGALTVRLLWIQATETFGPTAGRLTEAAVASHRDSVMTDSGRGYIVDRDGMPMAGFKLTTKQAMEITAENMAEMRKMLYKRRYGENGLARHLLGYTAQTARSRIPVGMAGLERSFEPFLLAQDSDRYVSYRDGIGRPLGHAVVDGDNPYYPVRLVTTIDRDLQRKIEMVMDDRGMASGAVVLLDAHNGDVLAMASRPNYARDAIDPRDESLRNMALTPEIPGSIFKTVVVAAALDAGVAKPNETFRCDGKSEYRLRCWNVVGDEPVTLKQAYAASYNVVFARLAVRLGSQQLQQAASRLGVARRIGWTTDRVYAPQGAIAPFRQFIDEEAGQLFSPQANRNDVGLLAQTGIGQRDVRVTPLQAASWVVAIVNDGWFAAPRVATDVRLVTGSRLAHFPRSQPVKAMSANTAHWLREAMTETARTGTAAALRDVPGGAAGKTGTAETKKHGLTHHWFIGFAPADRPQYAFAVLVRDQPSGVPNEAVRFTKALLTEVLAPVKSS